MCWNAFEDKKAFPENRTRQLQDCDTEHMEGGVRKFVSDPKEITLDAVVNNILAAIRVVCVAWETELRWETSKNISWRKKKNSLKMMGRKKKELLRKIFLKNLKSSRWEEFCLHWVTFSLRMHMLAASSVNAVSSLSAVGKPFMHLRSHSSLL